MFNNRLTECTTFNFFKVEIFKFSTDDQTTIFSPNWTMVPYFLSIPLLPIILFSKGIMVTITTIIINIILTQKMLLHH